MLIFLLGVLFWTVVRLAAAAAPDDDDLGSSAVKLTVEAAAPSSGSLHSIYFVARSLQYFLLAI